MKVNLRGKKTKSSSKQQLDECFKMTHAQTETNLNSIINYLQKERKEESNPESSAHFLLVGFYESFTTTLLYTFAVEHSTLIFRQKKNAGEKTLKVKGGDSNCLLPYQQTSSVVTKHCHWSAKSFINGIRKTVHSLPRSVKTGWARGNEKTSSSMTVAWWPPAHQQPPPPPDIDTTTLHHYHYHVSSLSTVPMKTEQGKSIKQISQTTTRTPVVRNSFWKPYKTIQSNQSEMIYSAASSESCVPVSSFLRSLAILLTTQGRSNSVQQQLISSITKQSAHFLSGHLHLPSSHHH